MQRLYDKLNALLGSDNFSINIWYSHGVNYLSEEDKQTYCRDSWQLDLYASQTKGDILVHMCAHTFDDLIAIALPEIDSLHAEVQAGRWPRRIVPRVPQEKPKVTSTITLADLGL